MRVKGGMVAGGWNFDMALVVGRSTQCTIPVTAWWEGVAADERRAAPLALDLWGGTGRRAARTPTYAAGGRQTVEGSEGYKWLMGELYFCLARIREWEGVP